MKRFETEFGDDGMPPGAPAKQGNLQAFGARYRFFGRTWGITIWARDWADAGQHCNRHGLILDGKILSTFDATPND